MGSIRIIAGRFRGRTILVPDAPDLRPTGSRVREALFNILGQDLTGRSVLDLYAGTGALGLEALSRGATKVVFVEASPPLALGLRRSAEELGVGREAGVVVGRVEDVLGHANLPGPFDVILADPPYGTADPGAIADQVDSAGLLAPGGVLIVETPQKRSGAGPARGLKLVRSERYGASRLLFFK